MHLSQQLLQVKIRQQQLHRTGYPIANFTVKDQAVFNKYMKAAGTLPPKYNGKVIIYNENPTVLEGNPQTVIAVVEFSSLAEAERFYNSAGYTAARQIFGLQPPKVGLY